MEAQMLMILKKKHFVFDLYRLCCIVLSKQFSGWLISRKREKDS